ncbi:hypothetical protein NDU88_003885 [Pleurodeles waltl]|uniref:Uncharacterized protein n=1 Tax=Pleurodeles waltl TaxID=8319 RepID=A0AAV7MA26_PLEWA|nr:hypothetical protein NDU88_003885 [Pleurodeles waltl]
MSPSFLWRSRRKRRRDTIENPRHRSLIGVIETPGAVKNHVAGRVKRGLGRGRHRLGVRRLGRSVPQSLPICRRRCLLQPHRLRPGLRANRLQYLRFHRLKCSLRRCRRRGRRRCRLRSRHPSIRLFRPLEPTIPHF